MRGELRMGRGGDKIKDDFRFNSGKKSLGWYACAKTVENGMQWRDKITRKTILGLKWGR